MLSLSSLLNPAPSGAGPPQRFTTSPTISSPATSYTDEAPLQKQRQQQQQQQQQFTSSSSPPALDRHLFSKFNMPKDPMTYPKTKPRGVINFYPFEAVDSEALRAIRRFQVTQFGQILHSCLHIPYNSGKKDFYEKTGRESFEVFKYDFQVPGHDTVYTVMWDYNIGLVRMTPFFKCCKYGKTVPAKMLNLNPGLKEITHSITGGSISAQGYWMPFHCAKAVCATFCYEIAGALIPIFGPSFPSQCIPPGAHDFQRMVIDPSIVYEAQKEAEMCRRDCQQHMSMTPGGGGGGGGGMGYLSAPERPDHRPLRPLRDQDRRLRIDTRLQSTYSTDTEADGAHSGPDSASSSSSGPRIYYHAVPGPPRHQGWTPANQILFHATPPQSSYPDRRRGDVVSQPPNPWLSAVPRFAPPPPHHHAHHHHHHHHHQQHQHRGLPPRSQPMPQPATRPAKRPIDYDDEGYEGGESQNGSPALKYIAEKRREENRYPPGLDASEKKAALLLMNLSVQDQRRDREQTCVSDVDGGRSMPRVKRRRATSL